jgi:hypothetical protein
MRSKLVIRLVAVAGAVILVGVAAVGVVAAQAQPATPNAPQRQERVQQYLEALAKRLNVSVDQLKQAMADARSDVQATQPARPNPNPGAGRDRFPGRPGFPGVPGGPGALRGILTSQAQAVAGLLNIPVTQLMQELPGRSLADVAAMHDKSAADVTKVIVDTASKQLDELVANNRISAERAAQMKQHLNERVQELVTRPFPARRGAHRGAA